MGFISFFTIGSDFGIACICEKTIVGNIIVQFLYCVENHFNILVVTLLTNSYFKFGK